MTLDELMAKRPEVTFEPQLPAHCHDDFRELGFTKVDRLTTDEELEWLGAVFDAMFTGEVELSPGAFVKDVLRPIDGQLADKQGQIFVPEVRLPQLRKTGYWRNGRRLSAQLLGLSYADIVGWGHMIRKPALTGEALPWHQDEAFWNPNFDYVALGCWMPLDPATVESGCMGFIPGSHLDGIRKHRYLNDDPRIAALVCDDVDERRAVPNPIPAGGASFHHCRTLHCSGANVSGRQRRAQITEWQLPPELRATPADRPWVAEGFAAKTAAMAGA